MKGREPAVALKRVIARVLGKAGVKWVRRERFLLNLRRGIYPRREPELAALGRFVAEGDTCLDVGANYGLYTYYLSRAVGPAGRVVSFEPLLAGREVLQSLVARFGLTNVTPVQVALGDVDGEGVVVIPKIDDGVEQYSRTYLRPRSDTAPDARAGRVASVETRRLDSYVREAALDGISFVKCDVEGAELMVLKGAEDVLARFRPTLLLEVVQTHLQKYGDHADGLFRWLAERGYKGFRAAGDRLEPAAGAVAGTVNYFFVHGAS